LSKIKTMQESLAQKAKRQLAELKAGIQLIKKEAELMDLVHTTTKLKLANAVGLLNEAHTQMEKYIPDGIEDSDYEDVFNRLGIFLTEIEKSEKNG